MAIISNLLGATELSIGRNPNATWIDTPDEMLYPPGTGTNAVNIGVSTAKAVSTYVLLSRRAVAGRKSAHLTVVRSAFLSAYNYIVTVDGTAYASTGKADAMATVADLVSKINTAAVGNIRASAVARTTDGVLDTVWVYETDVNGGAAANMTINFTGETAPSSGSAVPAAALEGYVDPASFSARLWVQLPTSTLIPVAAPWVTPQAGDIGAISAQGFVERVNVAGFMRLYVETYSVTKDSGDGSGVTARPWVYIAPAIAEV